jgi:hypothetical protein
MKHFFIFLFVCTLLSCQQNQQKVQPTSNGDNQIMDLQVRNMNDSAKQLLIDISNSAWFQAQMAEVGLSKMHDTSLLSLAQNISKQYTHIKDKAKIVSVPYKLNMPYFLRHDQNARVNELKGMDDISFTKEFLSQVNATNDSITEQCNRFQSMAIGDSDIVHFIKFTKGIVESSQSQLQKKILTH